MRPALHCPLIKEYKMDVTAKYELIGLMAYPIRH
ncbi:quinate/shikimate dehydrogenase, partial [Acinetobacter junii]